MGIIKAWLVHSQKGWQKKGEAKENGDKFADAENDDKEEEEEEKTRQSNDRQ